MTLERSTKVSYREDLNIKAFIKVISKTVVPKSRLPQWDLALVLGAFK